MGVLFHRAPSIIMAFRLQSIEVTDTNNPAGFSEFGLTLLEMIPDIGGEAGVSSIMLISWTAAQGMRCQRYKHSTGAVGIGSQPLPVYIKDSDCAW